jgi:5-methylcytosine-specific restriction endonuclease McrA
MGKMSVDRKVYMKKYHQENAEHIKESHMQWRIENPEYHKQWRIEHAEYDKQWRVKHAKQKKEYDKQRQIENPEKSRAKNRKRRALKLGASGYHTENDLQYIYEQQKGKCISCGNKFSYNKMTVDHIKPLSKGGSDLPYNIKLLCKSCNSSKGKHHETDYRKFEIDLLRNKSSIRMIFE